MGSSDWRIDSRNFGSSICAQRGAECVQHLECFGRIVTPCPVAQLDGDRVVLERLQEPFEVAARIAVVLEARGELREERAKLPGRRKRIDSRAKLVDIFLVQVEGIRTRRLLVHPGVRELLEQLERELEG